MPKREPAASQRSVSCTATRTLLGAPAQQMGSTLRHFYDSGIAGAHPLTLAFLAFALLLLLLSATRFSRSTVTMLLMTLILCDLPWEQSLMKREAYLAPLFQATLGRDEL